MQSYVQATYAAMGLALPEVEAEADEEEQEWVVGDTYSWNLAARSNY